MPITSNVNAQVISDKVAITPQISFTNSDGDVLLFQQEERTYYDGAIAIQMHTEDITVQRSTVELLDNHILYENYLYSAPSDSIVAMSVTYNEPIYLSYELYRSAQRTTNFGITFYSVFTGTSGPVANYTLTCDLYYIEDGELVHLPYSVSAQTRFDDGYTTTYLPISADIDVVDYIMIANYNITYTFINSHTFNDPNAEIDVSCPLINSSTYTSYVTAFNNLSLDLDLYSSIFPSIESFFTYPVFGLFSIGDILSVIVCITIILIILKYFAGG